MNPWHRRVFSWLSKRVTQDSPLSRRFPHDLGGAIKLAESGSLRHASAIVAHWFVSVRNGSTVHPRVSDFIDSAHARYKADPRRNIAKALLLVRPKAGNPGGVSRKRNLTPDGHREAALMVSELRQGGMTEKKAVLTVKQVFGVSERTIRKAVKENTE